MIPGFDIFTALTGALVELAGPVPARERARILAGAAAEACRGAGAGVLLTREDGTIEVSAGSSPDSDHLAALERQGDAGPVLGAIRSGEALSVRIGLDAAAALRAVDGQGSGAAPRASTAWTEAARAQGLVLAESIPLAAGGPVVGGLVILGGPGWAPTAQQRQWVRALAGVGAAGLLQLRDLSRARQANEQLQEALRTRVVIEQAKGVLAERGGLDVSTAFARLRWYTRARRRRLADVAQDVVGGEIADEVLIHTTYDT
jgi:hypothetical protein